MKQFQIPSFVEDDDFQDITYNWADNEIIILVRSKFDDKRLSLTQMLNDKVLDLDQIALSLLESNTSWMENIGL